MVGLYLCQGIVGGFEILWYIVGFSYQKLLDVYQEFVYDLINNFELLLGLEKIVRMDVNKNVFQKGILGQNVLRVRKLWIVGM